MRVWACAYTCVCACGMFWEEMGILSTENCFKFIEAEGGFQMPSKKELKRSMRISKKLNEEICKKKGEHGNKSCVTRLP